MNRARHFISLADHNPTELRNLLELARHIKLAPQAFAQTCAGLSLGMIFRKPSLRTRVSFQTGIFQLGGQGIYLGPTDIQLHRGEPIADTARVLSRMVDGIMARLFDHQNMLDLAENAEVPVINGLTDFNHPCQVLADLLTIHERRGRLSGLKLAYVGDGNNMAHSLLHGCALMGMEVAVGHAAGYAPDAAVVARSEAIAAENGGKVVITEDAVEAVRDADVVYGDVWASMGQEDETRERLAHFADYTVDAKLFGEARRDAIYMHCLPAHRGEEVTSEVIDGPRSVIFDQAENRLHAQKAVMVNLMGARR